MRLLRLHRGTLRAGDVLASALRVSVSFSRARRRWWTFAFASAAALVVVAAAVAAPARPLENVGQRCVLEASWTYDYRAPDGKWIKVSGMVRWRRATFAVSNRLYSLWPEMPAIREPSYGLRVFRSGSEPPLSVTSTEAGVRNRKFLAVEDLLVLTPRRGGYIVRWLPDGLPLPGRAPLTGFPATALPARSYSSAALSARRVVVSLVGTKRFDFADLQGRYRGTLTYALKLTF